MKTTTKVGDRYKVGKKVATVTKVTRKEITYKCGTVELTEPIEEFHRLAANTLLIHGAKFVPANRFSKRTKT